MTNVFLTPWATPFELPPFDQIRDADFMAAFEAGLAEARAAVAAITSNPEAPTFANTIEALELAEETLSRVAGVFYNLAGADSNPAREALQRDLAPVMAAWNSERALNPALFARIEALWAGRDTLALSPDQARLLLLYRRGFVRAGAALDGDCVVGARRLIGILSSKAVSAATYYN